jgi:hypothetical protein
MIGRASLAARPGNRKIVTDPFDACLRIRRTIAAHAAKPLINRCGARPAGCRFVPPHARMPIPEVWVNDVTRPVLKCAPMSCRWPRHFAGLPLLVGLFTVSWTVRAAQNGTDTSKDAATDLKSFVGTWKASFNGEVFAVLVLRNERGSLAGTLNNFDISVDKDGNLSDGTHKDSGDAPLLNARFKSGALEFVVMQKDQYAPSTQWKFAPKSADEGELTPLLDHQVNAPKDMVVKPIRMVRERPSK